ncbi:MAG: glycosyltransferase family 4 protein [Candidatus Hadarchaeota archaeon]
MKIAMLAWESLHSVKVGGLSIVVSRQAEELSKRGHDVHVITRWADGQTEYEYVNGVHYHRCKFDPGLNLVHFSHNMSMSFVARLKEVEKTHGKFDIIHGHDWHIVDALHELKVNEKRPVVITYHSTEYGRNGSRFGDWWEFGEVSGKEWYGGLIADRVTTVSHAMKNELNWLYKIPPEKIDVTPNAVDPRKYQMKIDPGRIKERHGVHPLAPLVLYIGRVDYQKGPDLLLEAIPKVISHRWDVKFIFAGDGGMRSWLEGRAGEFGVAQNTKFLGWVPYWGYVELLNAADMVCIPSRNEPFGIVLLEAWSTGRPVVACDVGGLGENIENFVNGIKVYPNPDSIAWGINYLLDNPDEMKKISEGAKTSVNKFSWTNVLNLVMECYNKVLGK